METYLKDVVAGHHFSSNRFESERGIERSDLKSSPSKMEKLLELELYWWRLWLIGLVRRRGSKLAGWIEDYTVGMLYRVWPKKSGVMRLFQNSWLQCGEQMNEILE